MEYQIPARELLRKIKAWNSVLGMRYRGSIYGPETWEFTARFDAGNSEIFISTLDDKTSFLVLRSTENDPIALETMKEIGKRIDAEMTVSDNQSLADPKDGTKVSKIKTPSKPGHRRKWEHTWRLISDLVKNKGFEATDVAREIDLHGHNGGKYENALRDKKTLGKIIAAGLAGELD